MINLSRTFILPVAAVTVLLAGCGSTQIDHAKAEALVRQSVTKAGKTSVTTVNCPTGITPKTGGTFNCQLTLADGLRGTVTLHETNDSGHVEVGPMDYHVH